jgi:hypothetical protein
MKIINKTQMNTIELNDLIINGFFPAGLRAGLTKTEIEQVVPLGDVYIDTPDITQYMVETNNGLCLSIIFDKQDLCVDMRLDLEENRDLDLVIRYEKEEIAIDENTPFEEIIEILAELDIEWAFDTKKTYLQTVCIRLKSAIRLYYAFGSKEVDDYGLFLITSIIE